MKKIFFNNPLFIVFFIPVVADVIGTVLCQPIKYWRGGYQVFDEALPIYPLLQILPMLFIIVCLAVWLPITCWLVKKLRQSLNLLATISLLVGHGYNSVNWFGKDLFQVGLLTEVKISFQKLCPCFQWQFPFCLLDGLP